MFSKRFSASDDVDTIVDVDSPHWRFSIFTGGRKGGRMERMGFGGSEIKYQGLSESYTKNCCSFILQV